MTAPKTLPRSWWANSDWRRGGAQLDDDDLHRLGNVNHYPGRTSPFGRLSLESLRRNIRGWWAYHVRTRGWSDIGYQTAIAMTADGPVIVDLRGIGRVPAAHASASNRRANWHGGATLWLIGTRENPEDQLVDAYRHYRTTVWLPRWPSATGVTHHRLVPKASTSCAGNHMNALVRSGALTTPPQEDDMPTAKEVVDELLSRRIEFPDWAGPDGADLYEPGTAFRVDSLLAGGYAHGKLTGQRAAAVLKMLRAQQPLVEAAAEGAGLSAEQVAEIAQACADAVPDDLAADMVDEVHDRLGS